MSSELIRLIQLYDHSLTSDLENLFSNAHLLLFSASVSLDFMMLLLLSSDEYSCQVSLKSLYYVQR